MMAAVLALAAILMCTVRLLTPDRLTPLLTAVANKMTDADVSLGRAELSLQGSAPWLHLRLDSLRVISRPMLRLRAAGADIPARADTLVCFDSLDGSISLGEIALGRIAVGDVILAGLRANIYTASDGTSNYDIYTSADTTVSAEESGRLPAISVEGFALIGSGPVTYTDAVSGTSATLMISTVNITGNEMPGYTLEIAGDIDSPLLAAINRRLVTFGADGRIGWNPEEPSIVKIDGLTVGADMFKARMDAALDLSAAPLVKDMIFGVDPVAVEDILTFVPDSVRTAAGIGRSEFATEMTVTAFVRLEAPYDLSSGSIPEAAIGLVMSESSLRMGRARFNRVGGKVDITLRGDDLNNATVAVTGLTVAGPATDLHLDATVTRLISDPLVKGTLTGNTALRRLPRKLFEAVNGAMDGNIQARLTFEGSPSMIGRNRFHELRLRGDVTGDNLYYLEADTANMVYAHHARFRFGTDTRVGEADSLLTAVIDIDSADIISGGAYITVTDFSLGLGTDNRRHAVIDSAHVIPMGGKLSFKKFNLSLPGHAATVRIRDTDGMVTIQRYNDEPSRPLFTFDLDIRRLSVGDPMTRFMLSGSELHLSAHKLPPRRMSPRVKHTADSLHRVYPDLPMDSVYAYALRKHRPQRGHRPRVHPLYEDDESEIIYWETSDGVKKLLTRWDITGSVIARRAGLFTAAFPVRNRMRNFNATFNNDSVVLRNIEYKAGASDFLISGTVSNMKRSFAGRSSRSPLRINFDVLSDTIDINELTEAAFRGAAAMEALAARSREGLDIDDLVSDEEESDSVLEHEIGRMVADAPDSVAPLLIPTNIDLRFDMRADNVLYGDMLFHDFKGELLAYDGALNLHHLNAGSDVGDISLSALYAAPRADDLRFGLGMDVNGFNIRKFMQLVPALDSIMPLMQDLSGIVSADIAATVSLDRGMNFELPTLEAAIHLEGDSLELVDAETWRSIGKWLLFKDRQRNIIDRMSVDMTVSDNTMQLYPFIFNVDRYKLGVQGYNDLSMNFKYHVAVLKSPLPFKFGINIEGNPDKYKIRLGRARLKENMPAQVSIADTTRVNLLREIENVFRRGVRNSRFGRLNIADTPRAADIDLKTDTISAADSAVFIREGLIPAPPQPPVEPQPQKRKRK